MLCACVVCCGFCVLYCVYDVTNLDWVVAYIGNVCCVYLVCNVALCCFVYVHGV